MTARQLIPLAFGLSVAVAATSSHAAGSDDQSIEALQRELEALKERLEAMETLKERVRALETELEKARARQQAEGATAETQPAALGDRQAEAPPPAEPEKNIEIGGALRFNYFWTDFDESVQTKRGDAGLDIFRLEADGNYNDVLISAEYRWYPYQQTIHHGWLGYDFAEQGQVQVGITQVPFGLLPYAAHNYWFGLPYYTGLSDDYDLGVKYVRQDGPWDTHIAFFKNEELGDATNLERYSYDVVRDAGATNEETNQLNARVAYTVGRGTGCAHELGASAQWGELFNTTTGNTGDHWAAAAHLDSRCGRWNLQLEAARYGYDQRNPAGVSDDVVRVGAFSGSHDIAAQGTLGVVNVAYNVPVPWKRLDSLTCYNDFSILHKDEERFDDSMLNTTGCAIGVGPLFTYVDLINARNTVFFSDGSLAGGGNDDWDTRFNINVGYYW